MTDTRATEDDIRHAYRLFLGREPDEHGFALYARMLQNGGYSTDELARYFLHSDEFLARNAASAEMVEVAMDGYSLFANTADRNIGASIILGQVYEPYVETVVREILRPGHTFIDVGANIGYFAALGAHLVGPSGHVVAWEPMDRNVQLIYAAIWRNRFENLVVYPFAASSKIGIVAMTSDPLGSNAGIAPRIFGEQRTRVLAQTQRLDELHAGIERVDLVKFDIEGHEAFAWQGAQNLLARHRPSVLTEFHPKCIRENTGRDPVEYLAMLLEYSGSVQVLHRERARVVCTDVQSILSEWQRADDDYGMGGGMHLDLFLRPSRN